MKKTIVAMAVVVLFLLEGVSFSELQKRTVAPQPNEPMLSPLYPADKISPSE